MTVLSKLMRYSAAPVAFLSTSIQAQAATDSCQGKKVLIVMSASDILTLDDGSQYPTGVFLREWTDPLYELVNAGCDVEYATPGGKNITIDNNSLELLWQYYPYIGEKPKAKQRRQTALNLAVSHLGNIGFSKEKPQTWDRLTDEVSSFVVSAKQAAQNSVATKPLYSIKEAVEIAQAQPEKYAALLVPGGHVPMEDLVNDKENFGELLKVFHNQNKPTSLICHAPVALLAAQTPGEEDSWIYKGYRATTASRIGEQLLENIGPLQGYKVISYVDDDLDTAYADLNPLRNLDRVGVKLRQNAYPGFPQVIIDRELITGQNPASAPFVGATLVQAIEEYLKNPSGDWWKNVNKYITSQRTQDAQARYARTLKKTADTLVGLNAADFLRAANSLFGSNPENLNVFIGKEYLAFYDAVMATIQKLSHDGETIINAKGEKERVFKSTKLLNYNVFYKPYFNDSFDSQFCKSGTKVSNEVCD